MEAEPGEYNLKIVAKLPPKSSDTEEFGVLYFECQLYSLAATSIPSAALRPASLNYFGLLGPEGKGFGQATHHIAEILLQPRQFVDYMFNISSPSLNALGAPAVDVQAIEADGHGDQLDISLREIVEEELSGTTTSEDGAELPFKAINIVEKHPF